MQNAKKRNGVAIYRCVLTFCVCISNYGLQHKVGDPTNPLSPLKGEMSAERRQRGSVGNIKLY